MHKLSTTAEKDLPSPAITVRVSQALNTNCITRAPNSSIVDPVDEKHLEVTTRVQEM